MGTTRYAVGSIHFDPPVYAGAMRGDRLKPYTDGSRAVTLQRTETVEETDEGTVTRVYADYLIPTWDSDGPDVGYYGLRHIHKELAELVDALGDDRTYSGQIEVCADTAHVGDFEAYRLTVGTADRRPAVYRTAARVVWDDEPTSVMVPARPDTGTVR